MRNPFNHPAWIDISLLVGRVLLGLYMLLAGWGKLRGGIPAFVNGGFAKLRPDWLPEALATPYGYAIPFLELLGGLMLILGLFTRTAAGVLTLVLLSISIAQMNANGITGAPPVGPFHHAYIMTAMCLMIAIIGSGRLALDPLYFGSTGEGKKS